MDSGRLARQGCAENARSCVIVASDLIGLLYIIAQVFECVVGEVGSSEIEIIEIWEERGWICRRSCNAGCISDMHVKPNAGTRSRGTRQRVNDICQRG